MTATWPEALVYVALGAVLRSLPRIVRVLCSGRADYLSLHRERRQMFSREP